MPLQCWNPESGQQATCWWQSWATDRLRQRSRLGLGLQDDPAGQARAVVAEIGPLSLANGRVILGDVIIEAGGAPLPTTRPSREVARRYRDCGDADTFSLKVLRGGKTFDLTLPVRPKPTLDLSGFDPPEVLRNLAALLGSVESIEIRRFAAPRQSVHVTATLTWNRDAPSDE